MVIHKDHKVLYSNYLQLSVHSASFVFIVVKKLNHRLACLQSTTKYHTDTQIEIRIIQEFQTFFQVREIADCSTASSTSWHLTPSSKSGLKGLFFAMALMNSATSITNESA